MGQRSEFGEGHSIHADRGGYDDQRRAESVGGVGQGVENRPGLSGIVA
jgi:hypothetical protein